MYVLHYMSTSVQMCAGPTRLHSCKPALDALQWKVSCSVQWLCGYTCTRSISSLFSVHVHVVLFPDPSKGVHMRVPQTDLLTTTHGHPTYTSLSIPPLSCCVQAVEDHSAGVFQPVLEDYTRMENDLKM